MKNSVSNKNPKVHFIGIGGSGMSAAALISKSRGFDVTGCDREKTTSYLAAVKKQNIKVFSGHNPDHINNSDFVVATPALSFSKTKNEEYDLSIKKGILFFWDEFLNKYILNKTNNICISGTHGKSTTTAWAGLLFEKALFDPTVLVGAQVKKWDSNARIGKSDMVIIESDEFSGKFLNYNPQTIIINNIEFDHPDYFKNEKEIYSIFTKFVKLLPKNGNLIVNLDDIGINIVLNKIGKQNSINIYGYSLKGNNQYPYIKSLNANISKMSISHSLFSVYSKQLEIDSVYKISIPGEHNVYNSLGVIILSRIFSIPDSILRDTLLKFEGIKRRLDLISDGNIKIYDDYAHHPTAIKETIKALRQKHPTVNLIVIYEAHSYSRTKALINDYLNVFDGADKVIIGPIFKARDTKTYGINEKSIVKACKHKNIVSFTDYKRVLGEAKKSAQKGSVIIVMGAGESYKWTQELVKLLK